MFVMVSHNNLIVKLVKYGLEGEIKVVGKLSGQPGQNSYDKHNWRPISSVVFQGLILEQILFNIFSAMWMMGPSALSAISLTAGSSQCSEAIHVLSYSEA